MDHKFDFTSIMDRRGKDAVAVNGLGVFPGSPKFPKEGFDLITMWIADMNYPCCPTIQEEMITRIQHPAFGYEYINAHFKVVSLAKPQGTYMMMLDCEQWLRDHNMTIDELQQPIP